MAKLPEEVLREIKLKVNRSFDRAITSGLAKSIANDMAAQIVKRTRLGKGVNKSGKLVKLKALKKNSKYIKRRRKGPIDSTTSPKKSNLTFTGQLLRAIKGSSSGRKIIIILSNNRNDGILNSDIVEWQEKQGRRFFDLSKSEANKFTRIIRQKILDQIEFDTK